jgi:hypothetical protein
VKGISESVEGFVDRWVQAEWRGDVTDLTVLLDEDFIALPTNCPIIGKSEWLRRYQHTDLVHIDLSWSTTMTISRRHFCIVTGQLCQTSSFEGRDASATSSAALVVDLDPSPRLIALFVDVACRPNS